MIKLGPPPHRNESGQSNARSVVVGLLLVAMIAMALFGRPPVTGPTPPHSIFTRLHANEQPSYNGLALTPPMGWSTWAGFKLNLNEDLVLQQARFLVDSGLAAKGYRYVNVDGGWMLPHRGPDGQLIVDREKFPSGMKALGDKLHAMGLEFGIYTDAGDGKACGDFLTGSYGHEKDDLAQFVDWNIDYIKIDGCYVNEIRGSDPEVVAKSIYNNWSQLIQKSGRSVVFSNSAPAYFSFRNQEYYRSILDWAPAVSNLWRVGIDVANYDAPPATQWETVIRNFAYTAPLRDLAGPGHFNDPDYLIIGNGMSLAESRTQMGLWVMMAAPLLLSTDLTKLPQAYLDLISNAQAIAIDQDPLGVQGTVIGAATSDVVMVKPLVGRRIALLLANLGDKPVRVATSFAAIDAPLLPASWRYEVLTVLGEGAARTGDRLSAELQPHDSTLLVLQPLHAAD